jgi:hypothetical protein
VDDVTDNQNSSTNSDLPKPAVDDVSDQSSDANTEPAKAVVEKKEEVKDNKDEEVIKKLKVQIDNSQFWVAAVSTTILTIFVPLLGILCIFR